MFYFNAFWRRTYDFHVSFSLPFWDIFRILIFFFTENFALLAGLFWYRCYYPHRWRDALSPVCEIFKKKTLQESQKAAPKTFHRLSRCQVVFTKRCHYYYCHDCYWAYCHYYYFHNLSFVTRDSMFSSSQQTRTFEKK